MLQVHDLSYSYPEADTPALAGVSFAVHAGECVCVTGHSGCGKSTLLLAVKGLLHDGSQAGRISVDLPSQRAGSHRDGVGIVFQNAETQILCTTVAEEVAFGPENLCVPADEIGTRIVRSLAAVQLSGFEQRNVERLSAGQKHRLAIASVLSMNPCLLLLDEPTSQLDGTSKGELVQVLSELKKRGYCLLIAEHNLEPFAELIDRYLLMEKGKIVAESRQVPVAFDKPERCAYPPLPRECGGEQQPAIEVDRLCLSYPDQGEVLRDFSLRVSSGERIHLFGRNGSGKSTLLRCLAGVTRPDAGSIRVAGTPLSGQTHLMGTVGYLFQNPQRQLFENTVHEEVAFSLKRLRLADHEVRALVEKALVACEAEQLSHRLPLSLSFGEQHRVALASVLAPQPRLLLLDEPFSGLDLGQRYRLLKILADLREAFGATVLIASHDPLPDPRWADRTVSLEDSARAHS
jgi:energy-coupling factor transport system ATP-binding protein